MTQAITPLDTQRVERLGPAERIINTITAHIDHAYHNRTGIVTPDASAAGGMKWTAASWRLEGEGDAPKVKAVYRLDKVGTKTTPVRIGVLGDDGKVRDGARVVAEFRAPGIFPEVAAFIYQQIADVWKTDNEFAARWASWAMSQDHRDLKVMLAAFMLVQNRYGASVRENGVTIMRDDDYRAVGEAMVLTIDNKKDSKTTKKDSKTTKKDGKTTKKDGKTTKKDGKDRTDINPRMLMRIGDVLATKQIADINHALGFGQTTRRAAFGRYALAVEKWLAHREANPKMLDGLVNAGYRSTVRDLARRIGYKPTTPYFFQVLRWKQMQAADGRRAIGIGDALSEAESWAGLTEAEICERIEKTKPNYKRIVGMIPPEVKLTQAIMAAAIENGALSDNDFIIYAPTIDDLGLFNVPQIKTRWEAAVKAATAMNRRSVTIAARVTNEAAKAALVDHADDVTKKEIEEVTRGLMIFVIIDKSGSMQLAMDRAKSCLATFVQGFPPERLRVSVFNSQGSEVVIKHPSAAGVEQAFRGHNADGGTTYAAGVSVLAKYIPKPEEGVDVLPIFVGDQEDSGYDNGLQRLVEALRPFRPSALGMLHFGPRNPQHLCVEKAAVRLGVPCIPIDEKIFSDAYSSVRTLRNLIASTPVAAQIASTPMHVAPARVSLIETILRTDLLERPIWAVKSVVAAAA